jgi:two-component system, NarL family, response regulator LiaR
MGGGHHDDEGIRSSGTHRFRHTTGGDHRSGARLPAHAASSRVTVRVLIANHQPIVRHGLWDVIASEPDLQLVGETDDGREAVRLARQLRPDVVLIDLSIPTVDGISATRIIRAELPNTQVIVMTGVDADTSALEAIRAGAAAYLLKDARIDHLLRTIRGAGAGQVALPAQTAARMVQLVSGHTVLSRRETEVLNLVARGLANKEVARELGVTRSTVKAHVSAILSKLGLPSRTQLALYAVRTGLVALDHLGSRTAVGETGVLQRPKNPEATLGASGNRTEATTQALTRGRARRRESATGR